MFLLNQLGTGDTMAALANLAIIVAFIMTAATLLRQARQPAAAR